MKSKNHHFEPTFISVWSSRIVNLSTAIVGIVAVSGLLGYFPGLGIIGSIRPDYIPMAPSTACSFLILVAVLFLKSREPLRNSSFWAMATSTVLVMIFALLEVVGSFVGMDLNLEGYLTSRMGNLGEFPIGQMSPITALTFIVAGLGTLFLLLRSRKPSISQSIENLASIFGFMVLLAGATILLAYLYGTPLLYSGSIIPMAATTAISFLFLGAALIALAGPRSFPVCWVIGTSTSAKLSKAFIPLAITVVLIQSILTNVVLSSPSANYSFYLSILVISVGAITAFAIAGVSHSIGSDLDELNRKLRQSEEKYRDLVESSPDLHYRTDTDGKIVFISPSVQKISGYTAGELIGIKLEELYVNREERKTVLALLQKNRIITEYEAQLTRKDGSIWWASTNAHFFKNNEGHILGVEGVTRDVTERKLVEDVLHETQERLATFMNSATDGFILFDSDFYHLEMNKTALEITGLERKNVIGKQLVDVFPDIKETPRYAAYKKVRDTGIPYHVTDLTSHPLTGDKYIELKAFKVSEGVGMIFTDITERKRAEKERIKLENRLQQAQKMESIGTLAGGIAHDFNNILSAILGYAEMAKDDCQPGSTIFQDLHEVLEAGNRAKSLVRQILAFSRQDDKERMLLQPASIVKETITMLRPSLPTTIEITQDIDAVTGLVFVDPSQLNQILMNLCTNAFHAMEATGGKLDISLKEVTLSNEDLLHEPDVTDGTFIQLSIGDSGTGIVPTVKDKIFDPYFTTKETGKGTGMGLSMVHGIVKNYGGFISFYSELGEGTVFHVFLPTVEKEALTENEVNDLIPIGKERILFVDDEEILTQMGKTMLERLGYHVTVRNNSLEALETFQNQPDMFDIVITDQTMPGMTGSDLSRRMLQIRSDIPIILCTGYSTIISEDKAKSMGIKEFAFKPLAKKDIAKLIRKVLDVS